MAEKASSSGWLVLGALLLQCGMWCGISWGQSGPAPASHAGPAVEEIEVQASSGPRMWKLTRADQPGHVVWVYGTMDLLPRKMTWDSRGVEKLMDETEEVIPQDPDYDVDIGFISGIRLYMQWRHIRELKDGKTLKDVLAPDLYARFSALRARYGSGPRDLERLQPVLAAQGLEEDAIKKSGLVTTASVRTQVVKIAKKHHVPIRKMTLKVVPRELVQELGEIPLAAQTVCLDAVLSSLEKDLGVLKDRARAWAAGDVQALQALPLVNTDTPCQETLAGAEHIKAIIAQTGQLWVDAVKDTLVTHKVSLAVQDIDDLLGAQSGKGWLKELQAAGFTIEGPGFDTAEAASAAAR
jgi:uncharacterized protein YbaP (TraB family)